MVVDEVADHLAHRLAVDIERAISARASRRADLGLLAGEELGVGEQAMLQVVDADGGGVAKADRAQVAGDLEAGWCAAVTAASSSARVMSM